MIFKKIPIHIILILISLIFYVSSYSSLHDCESIDGVMKPTSGIWRWHPLLLSIVSGEFKGLFADYLTLEAAAQVGTELKRKTDGDYIVVKKTQDWQIIHDILKSSQMLDPYFAQTFIVAQGWLPWEKMVNETQLVLSVADENRTWDWQPSRFMGFNSYYFLNNRAIAGKYFLEAAERKNAPEYLSILGSRLSMEGGDSEFALLILRSMLKEMSNSDAGYYQLSLRVKALEGVRALSKAKLEFEGQYKAPLESLADLTNSGILEVFPSNPYGVDYCLDSQGVIHFDSINCNQ